MRFQVEYISNDPNQPFVFVRQLDAGEFSISSNSRLGNVPINIFVNQPRKLKPDGTPDISVFAFHIKSKSDISQFSLGQVMELS